MLIEDLDFLDELEALRATVALAMFALFEKARDIDDDWAARGFLDLEVGIFRNEGLWLSETEHTPFIQANRHVLIAYVMRRRSIAIPSVSKPQDS